MGKLNRKNKKIVIGVSGGIAAYKSIEIIRLLQKKGYENIDTILTENGAKFVTPLTFEAITGKTPYLDTFENSKALSHIEVVKDADAFLIVPATANTIGKMANGIVDNFLTTAYLASKSPVLIAPSMNETMYLSKPVMRNLNTLEKDGAIIIEPESGYLACGITGKGRLADLNHIVEMTDFAVFRRKERMLHNLNILITSGGTEEFIDPVRTITNKSTGKMGKALAETLSLLGANVTIVSARCDVTYPSYCNLIKVTTAEQMKDKVFEISNNFDVIIMAAAVSDFTPSTKSTIKIKKTSDSDSLVMSFKKTFDILKGLGTKYGNSKVIVGFAAETDNVLENALKKIEDKNASFIVANLVGTDKSGFGTNESEAYIIDKNKQTKTLGTVSKSDLAYEIACKIKEVI